MTDLVNTSTPLASNRLERVIDHPSQLNALSSLPGFRPIPRGRLRLAGSIFTHPKRVQWEKELNASYGACGCGASAKFMVVAIAIGLFYLAVQAFRAPEAFHWGRAIVWCVGFAIAAAALGKLAGLAGANRRLKTTVREIQRDWKVEPPKPHEISICG